MDEEVKQMFARAEYGKKLFKTMQEKEEDEKLAREAYWFVFGNEDGSVLPDRSPEEQGNFKALVKYIKAQILKEELDKNGLTKEHYEKLAQYIRGNVVPQQIREAITDMLAKLHPNIMHLCAQEAGWINIELTEIIKEVRERNPYPPDVFESESVRHYNKVWNNCCDRFEEIIEDKKED